MSDTPSRLFRLLHLEDSPTDARYIHDRLDAEGLRPEVVLVDSRDALHAALSERFDLVLCDYNLPGFDGLSALKLIRERQPEVPVIVVSGSIDEEEAVKCLHLGATDYLLKQRMERFVPAVRRALQEARDQKRRRTNESLLRLAGRFARLGGWAVDLPAADMELSDEVCALHGLPPGSRPPLGDFTAAYTKDSRLVVEDAFNRCIRDGTAFDLEAQLVTAAGQPVSVRLIGEAVRDPRGAVTRVHGALQDITERKAMDARLLRIQRLESIGTLAGGIAHDLNNVLAPIVMGVDLLKQGALDPEANRVLKNIEKSARRGTDLVKQVLSFARGVEGARVAVHLGHVIAEVVSIATNSFPKNIEIITDVPSHLPLVTGDPTQLSQVLLNLCVNARDALPRGGQLVLSATSVAVDGPYAATQHAVPVGHYVKVCVTDTGEGIPKHQLERIFDPFFTTKEQGKGTGLGLATSLGIVRSHGGYLNVTSEPGVGSRFEVFLPATGEVRPTQSSASTPPFLPQGSGELVLVVDDETAVTGVTRDTLERNGYRVITAQDGSEAVGLYALHRNDISVVLTDLMMPVMDGSTLITALKRITPSVRIIAASGLDAGDQMAKATRLGVRHFLAKPYTAETLLVTLQQTLEKA